MAAFSDDFNRADSSTLGANWVEVSGDWSIVSNRLSSGSAGGTVILRAAGAMASNDHYAQVTITSTAAVSHGVWCRGNANITSGYLWRNDGSSWTLFSVVGGSFSSIGSYAAAAAPGDVAKVEAVGSTIKGYVNGVARVSVTDTSVASGTSVGLRAESTNSLRFDDFAAADVTAGATLGTASTTETAQTLTGSKTTTLSPAAATDTAQPLTGAKAAPLGAASASETAQQLASGKTGALGTAAEADVPQALVGSKTATLPAAAEAGTAQPLSSAKSRSLGPAESIEAGQPLTGAKSGALGPAAETSTARPLAAAGPDADIDVTVGAPYSPWTADQPRGAAWTAQAPRASDWKVGEPC
ncbi:hypothetical protein [Streptomyces sp. NPDC020377]|uniref:hypothetical protein n=1 Tax=Streptomyces sp. NPDC020377 TaxID=3365070 RepID=UPI0037976320